MESEIDSNMLALSLHYVLNISAHFHKFCSCLEFLFGRPCSLSSCFRFWYCFVECGIFGINKAVPSVVVINWKLITGSQEGVGQGKTGATAGIGAFGVFFGHTNFRGWIMKREGVCASCWQRCWLGQGFWCLGYCHFWCRKCKTLH